MVTGCRKMPTAAHVHHETGTLPVYKPVCSGLSSWRAAFFALIHPTRQFPPLWALAGGWVHCWRGLGLMFALIFVMRFPKTLISRRAQPFILPAFVTPSPCEPSTPSLTASHPMLPTRSQDCFVRHSRFCLNYDQASRSGKLFRTSIWIAIWCLRTPKPSRLRLASH